MITSNYTETFIDNSQGEQVQIHLIEMIRSNGYGQYSIIVKSDIRDIEIHSTDSKLYDSEDQTEIDNRLLAIAEEYISNR